MGGLVYLSYYLSNTQAISTGIYSIFLVILGGFLFLFLRRAFPPRYEETLEKLSVIPGIRKLIAAGERKKEEISQLEKERQKMERIVDNVATKSYLNKRYKESEKRLVDAYDELTVLKQEIVDRDLDIRDIESEATLKTINEIEKFIEHRVRGDFVLKLGRKRITIPREFLNIYPFDAIGIVLYLPKLIARRSKQYK